MSYRKGEVDIEIRNKTEFWVKDDNGNLVRDENGDIVRHDPPRKTPREEWKVNIILPHSCDEWEIGGPDEARLLIKDLEAAIVEYEKI